MAAEHQDRHLLPKPADAQAALQLVQHHVRNKLGIIIGSIEIFRINETLSAVGMEDLNAMRRACNDILAYVENLPTFELKDGTL